jgi:hypothetical protein
MSTRKSLSGPNGEPILRANDSKRSPQLAASFILQAGCRLFTIERQRKRITPRVLIVGALP